MAFSVLAQHRKLERRHHFQRARTSCSSSRFAKCEISFSTSVCRHRYLHCFLGACGSAFMPGGNRVCACRHTLDSEAAIFRAHRKEGVLQYAYVSLHPGVLVAFHRNQHLITCKRLFDGRCTIRLCLIPLRIVLWLGVNIVLCWVAVSDGQLLISLNAQNMWLVIATVLIEHYCR